MQRYIGCFSFFSIIYVYYIAGHLHYMYFQKCYFPAPPQLRLAADLLPPRRFLPFVAVFSSAAVLAAWAAARSRQYTQNARS